MGRRIDGGRQQTLCFLMMDGENCWKVPNKKKRDSNCWPLLFCEICQIHCGTEATCQKSDKNKCGEADLEAHQTRRHSCNPLLSSVG